MSTIFGRIVSTTSKSALRASSRAVSTEAKNEATNTVSQKGTVLQKGAKRDPELYILLTIMTGAVSLAGWYFGRKPTSSSSEAAVSVAHGSMPWETDAKGDGADEHFKYQYHPGGDRSKTPKDAPSALHSTIVPNVTLPKKAHDRFNKWGKEGY